MKGKSVLLLVIALVCGAIASVGLTQMLNRPGDAPQIAMAKVFVTMKPIDINEELTSDNIKLEEWPKDRVPEGAIKKLEQVEGKFAMTRLYPGEPVLKRKLSDRRIGNEEKIPEGYRAVAVRTSAQSAVSNLLLPGTRVDVIVFLKGGNGIPRTQTRTILRDVRIFSVNALTNRVNDGNNRDAIAAKTVTLLVKPSQVQLLMLANQLGTIQFAMRKPDDTSDDSTDPTTTSELIGDRGEFGTEREDGPPTAPNAVADTGEEPDFLTYLNGVTSGQSLAPPVTNREPVGEMVIISGNQPPQKFQWTNGNDLPREVSFGGAPSSMPPMIPGLTPPGFGPTAPIGEQPGESSSEGEENAEVGEREV